MAEARSYVTIGRSVKGVELGLSEDEFRFNLSCSVPLRKSVLKHRATRYLRRLHNLFVNGTYPLGPIALGIVVVVVTILYVVGVNLAQNFVLVVDPQHWIRQGWLGHLVWNIGMLFPVVGSLPSMIRLAWFTMWATFIGFLILVSLQRMLLRLLFSYQEALYAGRSKKRSITLIIWGALVKILSGRKPLTYGFSRALPTRPLPSIKDTCARWLETERPLQTDEEFKKTTAMVEKFLANEGPTLQKYLRLKWLVSDNFVTDWWEKYCYHKGRSSIMINSNYYVLDGAFILPTPIRNARAGQLVHNIIEYNRLVEEERIPPMVIGGMLPLDMSQHKRMFATNRVPGRDCDHIKHYDYTVSKHIAVMCRGYYFKLDVIRRDGKILTAREIEDLLDYITAECERLGDADEFVAALPAMTAQDRTLWAETRETYLSAGVNAASLHAIESAILVLALDETSPGDFSTLAHELIHGSGTNRWFDKSVTLCAFQNGRVGLNCEHSWADAPVIAHMIEWVMMSGDLCDGVYQEDGHTKVTPPSGPKPSLPARLLFDLPTKCCTTIAKAVVTAKEAIADLDLLVCPFTDYGKGFVKRLGVSPDAYFQMALQITYYRNIGRFDLTYESGMTRLFKSGRTETIRPVSAQSVAFVRSFLGDSDDAQTKLDLLRASSKRHVEYSLNAMTGKGVDRHLFALYIVSAGKAIDSPFLKKALSEPWRLSTSQQPPNQTSRYNVRLPEHERRLGMGGGFGPVAADGYGVSYLVAGENNVFFHVSSKKACEATSSKEFARLLTDTLRQMYTTFLPLAKPAKGSSGSGAGTGAGSAGAKKQA